MKQAIKHVFIISLPIIIGAVVAILFKQTIGQGLVIDRIEFILNAIITCASALTGFVLTSVSILIGLSSSPIIKRLGDEGGLKELQIRYTETLILGIIIIMFCIMLGANVNETNYVSKCWLFSGIIISVAFFLSTVTTGYYLLRVISFLPNNRNNVISQDKTPAVPEGKFRI